MKLLAALVRVFKRPGQELQDFNKEVKALSDQDRDDLCRYFNSSPPIEGVEYPVVR